MRPSVALASASAVGLVAAVGGAAAPAMADDVVTTPCATITEQTSVAPTPHDNWYMDCIPQYGLGKAEFTIDSDVPYPDEFLDLDDPNVETSTNLDTDALAAYFGSTPLDDSSAVTVQLLDETDSSQRYAGLWIAPITSVGAVDQSTVPTEHPEIAAACHLDEVSYVYAYKASYGESNTTFHQVIAGQNWDYTIGGTSPDLYFFFPELDGPDDTAAVCITNGQYTVYGAVGDIDSTLLTVAIWVVPPYSFPLTEDELYDLGIFSRVSPKLAATGAPVDSAPALAAAGGLLSFGLLAVLGSTAVRRRRVRQ
jgi:hypothetical protein